MQRNNRGRLLRNNMNFHVAAEYYSYKNKITERATILWNQLPIYLKNTPNRLSFKEKLYSYFSESYRVI